MKHEKTILLNDFWFQKKVIVCFGNLFEITKRIFPVGRHFLEKAEYLKFLPIDGKRTDVRTKC